jgi:hypothetical protein
MSWKIDAEPMTKRRLAVLVAGATVLGALLRLPGLDTGLWFDEIVTLVESVRPPLLAVVTAFPGSNNHPLYSVLAHLSITAFGEHAWTLRLPALIFGVAAIPALYVFGQLVTSRLEAAFAALLLAVSYHGVWFSQNARGYTALLFFTLLATGILWQGGTDERRRQWRALLTAAVVSAAVAGALYAPTLGQVMEFFSRPSPPAAEVATPKWAVLEAVRGLQIGFGLIGVLCALVLAMVGGFSYLRRSPLVAFLFVLAGPITVAATVLLGSPLRPRFFFSLAGFGVLILIRGAMETGRAVQRALGGTTWPAEALGTALVGVLTVASLYSLRDNYRLPKQDFEGAARYIDAHRGPSDPVATAGLARFPYEQYYDRPWTPVEHAADLEPLRRSGSRVWAVYSFTVYMDPALVALLERDCPVQQVFEGTLGDGAVYVCAMNGAATP